MPTSDTDASVETCAGADRGPTLMSPTVMSPTVRAALLCIVSCAFFAGANAFAKVAQTIMEGPDLHPFQVTAARFLAAFIVLSPFLARKGRGVFRTAIPFRHLQRVLLGISAVTCIFAAVQSMPLAEVISIAWSAPLFALLFAGWFLRERVGPVRWIAAAIGFVGVAVMMRPGETVIAPAALLALAAAILTGAEVVTIRVLATRDDTLTVLALNNAIGTAIACSIAAFVFVVPTAAQALALFMVGATMVAGQAIFLKALAIAEASVVAPFYYATIIWAAVMGIALFAEVPGWHLYLGAALIIAGGLFVTLAGRRAPGKGGERRAG